MLEEVYKFTDKLCQEKLAKYIESYISSFKKKDGLLLKRFFSRYEDNLNYPLSINFDLTVACNYRCQHCIDKEVINTKNAFSLDEIISTLITLKIGGLRSVILIGGGEPTLYPQFKEVVRVIKILGLECAIVTNGSNNQKIKEIAKFLTRGDWIRFSLDAGTDGVFQHLHRPVRPVTLNEICESVANIKQKNSSVQIGFSFVIIIPDAIKNNSSIVPNYNEIETAAILAKNNHFDYISFKPYLVRDEDTKETIGCISGPGADKTLEVIKDGILRSRLLADGKFKIIESENLLNLFDTERMICSKRQPKMCHMQAFRQVISPIGIFGCPAYRGDMKNFIAEKDGYTSIEKFIETRERTKMKVINFDASYECKKISCIYNSTNWWLKGLIERSIKLDSSEIGRDTDKDIFL